MENDIFELAKKVSAAQAPFLYITCGTEDGLFASNRQFAEVVQQQKLRHDYRESPGAHTWAYWDEQLAPMLRVLARHMEIVPQPDLVPTPIHRPPTRGPRQPAVRPQ
jgi:S-formylglutathione hydrolase FrmB